MNHLRISDSPTDNRSLNAQAHASDADAIAMPLQMNVGFYVCVHVHTFSYLIHNSFVYGNYEL